MSARRRRAGRAHGGGPAPGAPLAVLAVVIAVVAGAGLTQAVIGAVAREVPRLDQQQARQQSENTYIYDGSQHPRLLAVLQGDESRVVVPSRRIAEVMKKAVVAIEDERFYSHKGVDYHAIARAFMADVQAGGTVQGGSTITQQFIKNTYIDPAEATDQSFARKIREALLAYQLEKRWSKDRILTNYLNTIYFGQGAYGVEMAARTFFGTTAARLTLAQAALLAGVIRDPSDDNPFDHPRTARQRRRLVLEAMRQQRYITAEQATAAVAAPLPTAPHNQMRSHLAPYFVEYVIQQLVERFGAKRALGGGLRVYTTLDPDTQRAANQAAATILDRADDPVVAIAAIDPRTGQVKALVGGRDFGRQQFNVAVQGRRQPGSAFKPFALAAALAQGMSPASIFVSEPKTIPMGPGAPPWSVATYSHTYLGPVTLRDATVFSDNTVYADLAMMVGPGVVAEEAQGLGVSSPVGANPSIVLGGLHQGVSPLDMAAAYATFANGGVRVSGSVAPGGRPGPISIAKVTDARGRVLFANHPARQQVLEPWKNGVLTSVLQEVVSRGTGTAAALFRPSAGKTGTTEDYGDAWFCGYTPDLAAAVWVGYPTHRRPLLVRGIRVAGGTFPAEIWRTFMLRALSGVAPTPFPTFNEPQVRPAAVCTLTGQLATHWCPSRIKAYYYLGSSPTQTCTLHGPAEVSMPSVEGLTLERAKTTLRAAQLGWNVSYIACEPAQKNVVLAQDPPPGRAVRQGTEVQLSVGGGPLGVVPHVVGAFAGGARALVEHAGFTCTVVWLGNGSPAGVVANQNPAGGTPGEGEVTIWVGGDGRDVTVPSVVGSTIAAARAALAKVGLDAMADDGAGQGSLTVAAQDPAAGARLAQGEAVTLTTLAGSPTFSPSPGTGGQRLLHRPSP
jgi:penicillin-binding protein 1A